LQALCSQLQWRPIAQSCVPCVVRILGMSDDLEVLKVVVCFLSVYVVQFQPERDLSDESLDN